MDNSLSTVITVFFSLGGGCAVVFFFQSLPIMQGSRLAYLCLISTAIQSQNIWKLWTPFVSVPALHHRVSFLFADLNVKLIIFPAAWTDWLRNEHYRGTDPCERSDWASGRVERWWSWKRIKISFVFVVYLDRATHIHLPSYYIPNVDIWPDVKNHKKGIKRTKGYYYI